MDDMRSSRRRHVTGDHPPCGSASHGVVLRPLPSRCPGAGATPGMRWDEPCGACGDRRDLESHSPTAYQTMPTKTPCTEQGKTSTDSVQVLLHRGCRLTPAPGTAPRPAREHTGGTQGAQGTAGSVLTHGAVSAGNRCPRQGLGPRGPRMASRSRARQQVRSVQRPGPDRGYACGSGSRPCSQSPGLGLRRGFWPETWAESRHDDKINRGA